MEPEQHHILVVDDDRRLLALLERFLRQEGFLVSLAASTAEADIKRENWAFDLLIVDVMMPQEDGCAYVQRLRADGQQTPILLLTARDAPKDRIGGFEAGADDYLAKPFEPKELSLRLRSILKRRIAPGLASPPARLNFGPWHWVIGTDEMTPTPGARDDNASRLRLTQAETALLTVLAKANGTVLDRHTLIERSGLNANPRTIDVQVNRLRRKLEPDPREPRYLATIRGEGYQLRPDTPRAD
jgi:two-component system phosphate regulon response regulator OmpR